jgi:AraC family transcriptional regulator
MHTEPLMADAALSVDYLSATLLETDDCERARDAIAILIPGGTSALSATYRTAEGREFTAFVRAPMIAVIPPGQAYRVTCDHSADTLVLQLAADFFDAQVRAALGVVPPRVVARYAAFDPLIRELANALLERLRLAQPLNPAYLQPLAGVIAVHLARHYGSAVPTDAQPAGLPQHKLKRVRAFIAEHMAEVLHVDRLAAESKLSPFHFARMFKLTTGQTPHLYVLMQRIERAKALLSDSETALIDIAADTGFRTQGHFTGVFRRYTGLTPRAFRLASRAAQQG